MTDARLRAQPRRCPSGQHARVPYRRGPLSGWDAATERQVAAGPGAGAPVVAAELVSGELKEGVREW